MLPLGVRDNSIKKKNNPQMFFLIKKQIFVNRTDNS